MNMIRISFALLCAALATVVISCSDNPADSPSGDHVEAFGLVIYNSGEEIVRYQNGVVEGEIETGEGEDTPLLTVRFLDESGNVISTDKLSGEHSMKWEIGNTEIAEVEHHSEDGKWSFHIAGKHEGETTLKIMLYHNDHADFTSKEIPIHVHGGVEGIKLLLNGSEALTADKETASGTLTMFRGTSNNVQLQFIDADGHTIALEDHHIVEIVPSNTSLVDITAGTANGSFVFAPRQVGFTPFRVYLKLEDEHGHGGEPVVLYESPAIVLNIEE